MASPPPNKRRKLNTDTLSPISRVAFSKDHFSVLELPPPVLDDLNRTIWTVQKSQIKKQYFKISRQVHPDKHVHDEKQSKRAADSFDIVQIAYQTLMDNIKREEYVNEYGDKLKYKLSKNKFDLNHNDKDELNEDKLNEDKDSNLSLLDKQNKDLEKSQLKRLKKKELMEKEANEYEQNLLEEFNERRKNSQMKRIRSKQRKRRGLKNRQKRHDSSDSCNDDSNDSDQDSDIDYSQTLLKLKNKPRGSKRRFR